MRKSSIFFAFLISVGYIHAQNLADSASYYASEFKKISEAQGTELWGLEIGAPMLFIDEKMGLAYLSAH